jgi:hypothetical protein
MSTIELSNEQIQVIGHQALLRELGPVGYLRFMQQLRAGTGDYTAERHQWLDSVTADQMPSLLAAHRSSKQNVDP